MTQLNSVQEFYKGKTIFITGGSGFMGKVLVEKLLYACSDVKELILLMRPKRGKSASQRVEDFSKIPLFKRIMEEKPEVMAKIYPVWGEITLPNMGLNDEHLRRVIERTEIIFHLAASLKLEATLKPNVLMNLTGTKHVLDVAKQMKNLIQMIHTSTAFCNVEQTVLEEKVYDFHHKPLDIIRCAEWMSEEAMAAIQKDLLGIHPNTYTYTKRLAEILVQDKYKNSSLPVCIVRPSIVGPSFGDPMPGWVDSLNGPPGIIIAAAKGALRCLLMDPNSNFEAIPVDIAISGILMIAKQLASQPRPKEIPVFNVTQHKSRRITYGYFFDIANSMKFETPCMMSLWYPNCELTQNKLWYMTCVLLFQWIPAYFVDFLMLIFGQKRFMVYVQKKISVGMDVLKFFTMNNWDFNSDNFQNLTGEQSKSERVMFHVDTKNVGDAEEYLRDSIRGGRVYCAREPLSNIPQAKIVVRIQYVVDRLVKLLILYWLIKKVLIYTGLMVPTVEYFSNLKASFGN